MNLYLMVLWLEPSKDDPTVLYYEIDPQHEERRCVQFFADGRLLRTDRIDPDAPISLGFEPFPDVDFIIAQPQFKLKVIDETTFTAVWNRAEQV